MTQPLPGRSCPAEYGYGPTAFLRQPDLLAETLYIVGGLYGNPFALDAVEALVATEAGAPQCVFNGDFHWFDRDPAVFRDIHRRVLQHTALRGNVETELASTENTAGCGCAYPDEVSDAEVAWSNQIMLDLRASATTALGDERGAMTALPMHLLVQVGDNRIGIVHGDAMSLAGWDFSRERLDDPARRAMNEQVFRKSDVNLFASSHTCLPVLRQFDVDGRNCAVINNGAAGMPNFADSHAGVISRIGLTPAPSSQRVLHQLRLQQNGQDIFVAAIALDFDHLAWQARFVADWPHESAANLSYLQRIKHGPRYTQAQAYHPVFD